MWYGGQVVLCSDEVLITGLDVRDVSQRVVPEFEGPSWTLYLQVTEENGRRLDSAASKLYNHDRSLRGKIAIIMDDKLLSILEVCTEAFHGKFEISGISDPKVAVHASLLLRSGELPFPIKLVEEK